MDIRTNPSSSHQGAPQVAQELSVDFTAENKEFWKLEIRNILLTIVTLGIYSPWASVSRRKYMGQHTFLDGANFEYTADPKIILRSRLVFFGLYVVLGIIPILGQLIQLVCMLAMPWAMACSIAFHAKNTIYRGARFSFLVGMKETYIYVFKAGFLNAITLGLALPVVMRMATCFVIEHLSLGGKPFSMEGDNKPFIKLSMTYALQFGGCLVAIFGLFFLSASTKSGGDPSVILGMLFGLGLFAAFVAAMWVSYNTMAKVANLLIGQIRFGGHRLESNQVGADLFWLGITNLLLVVCTFGLAFPIAVLRMRRYRYDRLKVHANGPLLQGVELDPDGKGRAGTDALGSGAMDIFGGFEFGF